MKHENAVANGHQEQRVALIKRLRPLITRGRIVSALGRRLLGLIYGRRMAPIGAVRILARLAGDEDAALPKRQWLERGADLRNRHLASRLHNVELGGWSLTASALNVIEEEIHALRPNAIVELGSGISTVCLAQFMADLHGKESPRVFSIDQDSEFAEETRRSLKALRLAALAQVEWAPLTSLEASGKLITFYDLRSPEVRRMLEGVKADMLLIDGPAGEPGIRFHSLEALKPYLASNAKVFLDDALRGAEIRIAEQWALNEMSVEGIRLIDSGLLVGTMTAPTD